MRSLVLVALLCASANARLEYPDYPGARKLCSRVDKGVPTYITWRSAATSDQLAKVVEFYRKALKRRGVAGDDGTHRFEDGRDRLLTIFPATKHARFPFCDTKPNPDENTVILVSEAS